MHTMQGANMQTLVNLYGRLVALASSRLGEGIALLIARFALAGVFWRSARTKVEEGSWLQISEIQYFIFENEFSGLPLPPSIAVPLTTYAEHFFPILLALGLATRFGALGLLVMTMVIQIFVFPEAWWQTHILWAGLAAMLIVRGGGLLSLDALLASRQKAQG